MTFIKSILADPFWFSLLVMVIVFANIMTAVAYAILLERKIAAWTQDRYGPNRVGPWGLLQPLADALKFLLKEDIIPARVDKALFVLAPFMIFVVALIGFAVIPWGGEFRWSWMDPAAPPLKVQVASIDIGLLYILAVASLSVYGVVLGAWASNNKYSFYGGMRAAAQMLSYEVPMGLVILVAIMTTGSLRLEDMVTAQHSTAGDLRFWTVVYHPAAALILFITALAEANRMPFDLAESEQELIGGYHTEYSAMKLALFFLAEYAHMITTSAFMVAMYFGGYMLPGWDWLNTGGGFWAMIARTVVFSGKIFLFICLYMLIRWTIPRFRFDQLMRFCWTALVPASMALVLLQALILYYRLDPLWALAGNVGIVAGMAFFSGVLHRPVTGRQRSMQRTAEVAYV